VAFNEALSQFAFIQVKSTDNPKSGWPVYAIRNEDTWKQDVRTAICLGERFFYVFVSLPNNSQLQPAYYVVPSAIIADMIEKSTDSWLAGKPGRKAVRQLVALQIPAHRTAN